MITRFVVTGEHLKLARRMCVGWQDCEYGAPEIDPKRPYGNRSVEVDIAEILGWVVDEDEGPTDEQRERAASIHREMETVLQIALATGSFRDGTYECSPYCHDWKMVTP